MSNREPKPIPDGQWTKAAIAADPVGAFTYIRQVRESRNAWQRKFGEAERRMKRKYRGRVETLTAALVKIRENGVNGSAWCVAVATEALSDPVAPPGPPEEA